VAVDAWRLSSPILQPLFDVKCFEPMITTIAKTLLVQSNLGLAKRVALGALLSMSDMISDLLVIKSYNDEGDISGARTLLAMISTNMIFQLFVVYAQNIKKSRRVLIRELMIVICCIKPAVDAYRVATGYEGERAKRASINRLER